MARTLGDIEIVSADSMSVYRGMDVGTAKPNPADRDEVVHHMLDVADPAEDYSLVRFQAEAAAAITSIEQRGRRALVVGGTGLYIQALVDGLTVPGSWPAVRAQLEAQAAEPRGLAAMYSRLEELDPVAAARMEPTNARRVVRATEVVIGSGRTFSSFGPGLGAYGPTRFRLVGVWLARKAVAARIEARFTRQMARGFLAETDALARRPEGISRTARQALGYRELLAYLGFGGESTVDGGLDEAVAEAVRRTRSFAKRQRAWFRRDPRINWLAAAVNPVDVLPALLRHWSS